MPYVTVASAMALYIFHNYSESSAYRKLRNGTYLCRCGDDSAIFWESR